MNLSPNVLAGISDPAIADVSGAMQKGKAAGVNEMAGEILSQTVGGRLGALGKHDPAKMVAIAQALGIPINAKERQQSMIGDIQVAASLLEAGHVNEAAQFAAEQATLLEGLGIQPTQYMEVIAGLRSGDPSVVQGTTDSIIALRDGFIANGMLKAPPGVAEEAANRAEVRKEARKAIRDRVTEIDKAAQTVESSYGKVLELAANVRKGNRISASQMLIALVKLGDPTSAVLTSEQTAALNRANTTAEIINVFRGAGAKEDVVNAAVASFDPLNPETIDVESVIQTANGLLKNTIPLIQGSFYEQRELADENLKSYGIKSIFGKRLSSRIENMQNMIPPKYRPVPEGLRLFEDAQGKLAYLDAEGNVVKEL